MSTVSGYEISSTEVRLTLLLGNAVTRPICWQCIKALHLEGTERVHDFGSGSDVYSEHLAARLQTDGHLLMMGDTLEGEFHKAQDNRP